MSCCLSSKFRNWCSRSDTRTAKDGNEYCIFHMPVGEKWLTSNEFHLELYGYIDDKIRGHTGCILDGTVFPQNTQFFHYDEKKPLPNISFRDCVFDHVNFWGVKFDNEVHFSGAVFNGHTEFRDAIFNKTAYFCGSKLKNYIVFENAKFNESALFQDSIMANCNFNNTNFKGKVDFENVVFTGTPDFTKAIFHGLSNFSPTLYNDYAIFDSALFFGDCRFNRSRFKNKAIFYGAQFRSNTDFTLTYFDRYGNFTNAAFFGLLKFSKSTFKGGVEFNNAVFCHGLLFDNAEIAGQCNLWNSKFEALSYGQLVDFENTVITDKIKFVNCDLENFKMLNVDIKKITFEACKFPLDKNGNRKIFEDREKYDYSNDVFLESIYRNLKLSAKNDNDELMTSSWHYKEKEVQLRRLGQKSLGIITDIFIKFRSSSLSSFFSYCKRMLPCKFSVLFETFALLIYKNISGFGEKPFKAGFVLFFLLLVPILFPSPSDSIGHMKSWLFYIPLAKVDLAAPEKIKINSSCILLRMTMYILITVQATIFGFSLRNKFRR